MCQWLCKFVEASKKIQKNQAQRLFRPRSIHLCYQTPNPARETVPLGTVFNLTFKSAFSIHIKTIEISTIMPVLDEQYGFFIISHLYNQYGIRFKFTSTFCNLNVFLLLHSLNQTSFVESDCYVVPNAIWRFTSSFVHRKGEKTANLDLNYKVSYDSWQDEDENNLCRAEQQLYDGQWEGRHLNNTRH
jgi:hypothetical protein